MDKIRRTEVAELYSKKIKLATVIMLQVAIRTADSTKKKNKQNWLRPTLWIQYVLFDFNDCKYSHDHFGHPKAKYMYI